jgi:UDP-2,3-diacylglucosamine hydrolase
MSDSVVFISDLHLEAARPQLTHLFKKLLLNQARNAKALYILGDFFEVWVGDDDITSLYEEVAAALREYAAKGTSVYVMHGNRDFLMGARFAQMAHCQLIPDPFVINLNGQTLVLTHGDLLCTDDKSHILFRRFVQHSWTKFLFLHLPLFIRKLIAKRLRRISQKRTRHLQDYVMDVNHQAVMDLMQDKKAQLLIHGHTHKAKIHKISLPQGSAKRIVLDAWHDKGNALIVHTSGEIETIDIT